MSMQIISWEEYISTNYPLPTNHYPLSTTIGVFDGIHLGHQALIQRICLPASPPAPRRTQPPKGGLPYSDTEDSSCAGTGRIYSSTPLNGAQTTVPPFLISHSSFLIPPPLLPTVITFRQNPLSILKPAVFTGDILTLDQKLAILEFGGVQLTVLIDFSQEFSKISGRDFIDLLLSRRPVQLIALGKNFRCGYQLDTGAEEIQGLAGARGVETWVAPPLMDGGLPISSSRIRQALAEGKKTEAERLMGRPLGSISP